jgi:glycosyltransferase involved in cell wall biosynthesis
MKIAIDISPLSSGHKVRGVGFYIHYLKKALTQYYPENEYSFFIKKTDIPNDADLVHYPYFDPFFLTLPIVKKNKTVVTVHDLTPILYSNHFPPGFKGYLKWKLQKHSLKRVDSIITDSFTSQRDIARELSLGKKNIDVVYLAASEDFKQLGKGSWRKQIITKFDLPEKFVLYVGDATWNKNIPMLIEAIKATNLTLVIVGKTLSEEVSEKEHPWKKDIVTVNKMIKGDKRFIKLGFVSTNDLVCLYNIATLFVYPSIYEGFGLPVLEAMQSGCATVIAKEGSVKEIGEKAAYYINPFNLYSMANGIGEVFFTPKLQKELSEKGIEQAKKFSWQKTAEKTVKIYAKTLKKD